MGEPGEGEGPEGDEDPVDDRVNRGGEFLLPRVFFRVEIAERGLEGVKEDQTDDQKIGHGFASPAVWRNSDKRGTPGAASGGSGRKNGSRRAAARMGAACASYGIVPHPG